MDQAAAPGEIANGAQKLIESMRKRGVTASQIEQTFTSHGITLPKYTKPDMGLIACPFKKHKGELARDIDPHYLRFMIRWIRQHEDPTLRAKFGDWANDMETFLSQ
jgi:hypothetical protein